MNAALGLSFRHPLHPVYATFEFQAAVSALALQREHNLLDAAQLGLVQAQHLVGPAFGGGIHAVHPEQAVGEQGRFLAARAAADLHNHVFSVVFVLWQQKQLEFLFQRFQLFLVFGQLLLYHFLKVRLQAAFVQQLLRLPAGFFGLLYSSIASIRGVRFLYSASDPGTTCCR